MKAVDMAVQWHITSNCPNRCKHCYMNVEDIEKIKAEEPSLNDLIAIYENIQNFENKYEVSVNHFILTGGDPFSSPYFKDFARYLKQHNKQISILSIPEAVTEENIQFMQEIGAKCFQMSMDGNEKTHDLIRGKGSYEKTLEAMKRMDGTGVSTGIMYTLHEMNQEEMFDVIDVLDTLNIRLSFAFDLLVIEGSAAKSESCQMLNVEQVDRVFERYIRKAVEFKEKNSKVVLTFKNNLLVLKRMLKNNTAMVKDELYSYCEGCYAGFSAVGILPNGDFMPCRRLDCITGNLHKETFEYLLLGEETMRKMRRPWYYSYCVDCRFWKLCRGCMAIAYSFYKDPFAGNPYCLIKEAVTEQKEQYCYPAIDCTNQQEWEMICDTRNNRMLMPKGIEDIRRICLERL